MRVLLFAGAGTSIELGVPGMVGLGEEFVDHAQQWNVEPDLVKSLIGHQLDVEHLIESLDRICTARPTLKAIGQGSVSLDRADKIRAEVEWFVQHAAERVLASDARIVWGPVLRAASAANLTITTTNYDRAIELAANAESVSLDDGFETRSNGETFAWAGFDQDGDRPILVKLHGSTDWYATDEHGIPTKLTHPMPLFGRARLRLSDGTELGSALVLPSREKLLTHSPYPRLSQTFLNAADSCDMAIFVGSSLRDHHVRDAAESTARRVPLVVVNPDGESFGLEGVRVIAECASTFLISTLPYVLTSDNPVNTIESVQAQPDRDAGILDPVRQALDADAPVEARCRALERLDESEVRLDLHFLRQLLNDRSATVARYALGLISLSSNHLQLVEEAATGPHANDPAFRQDLQMLRDIL